jgi:hypothetical protein
MDVRKKLVELVHTIYNDPRMDFHDLYEMNEEADTIAEIMIENGATVQEWISVKDRLPENDTYILATTDGVVVSAYWHNDRFYAFTANGVATVGCVTHWMPLPEPLKGE